MLRPYIEPLRPYIEPLRPYIGPLRPTSNGVALLHPLLRPLLANAVDPSAHDQ